jgi:hypothetical protein
MATFASSHRNWFEVIRVSSRHLERDGSGGGLTLLSGHDIPQSVCHHQRAVVTRVALVRQIEPVRSGWPALVKKSFRSKTSRAGSTSK